MAGKPWYTNDEIEIQAGPNDIIPDGFHRGRLKWTDEKKAKISGENNHNYGKPGYWTGKKMPPDSRGETLHQQYASGERQIWNKGLTKETNPILKKWSDERTGREAHNKGVPMSDAQKEKIKISQYLTKKKNNSFNKSQPEEDYYQELLKLYPEEDILRQYKDQRYPFACDFYIKSLDIFIEINKCWTHGGRPYDPNDLECEDQLNNWRLKAEAGSQFYKNAIYTWTDLDVRKQKIAKQNNLNYITIY